MVALRPILVHGWKSNCILVALCGVHNGGPGVKIEIDIAAEGAPGQALAFEQNFMTMRVQTVYPEACGCRNAIRSGFAPGEVCAIFVVVLRFKIHRVGPVYVSVYSMEAVGVPHGFRKVIS